ncbi:MAG: hypothetical protein V7K92_13580 [Nostoc sp.]|uniref:hypothetical protein n=1 Tax=Nostoc sp. TaxID=1180 RepID=UPI002FF1FD83
MFQNELENILVYYQNNFKYAFVENDKAILVIHVNLKLDWIREQGISSLEVLGNHLCLLSSRQLAESHDQGRSPSVTSAIEDKPLVEKVFRHETPLFRSEFILTPDC